MYGTLEDWIAFALARGNEAVEDADEEVATAALVRASDYIKYTYVVHFSGVADTIPEVEEATYHAAALELTSPGFFSKTYTASQTKVLTAVEGIKWTPVASGEKNLYAPKSTLIESMLGRFVGSRVGALWV
jgi:hypothetical protein